VRGWLCCYIPGVAMRHETEVLAASYDPNRMFDLCISKLKLKNDAALCRLLEVQAPIISKIRHARSPLSSKILLRVHEVSGIDVKELQKMAGDRRTKYRLSDVQGKPGTQRESAVR